MSVKLELEEHEWEAIIRFVHKKMDADAAAEYDQKMRAWSTQVFNFLMKENEE